MPRPPPPHRVFLPLVVAWKTSYDCVNVPADSNKTYMPVAFKVAKERIDRKFNLLQGRG